MPPEELEALLAAPALAPPPGVTPNFDNPHNGNGYAWGITTVCMIVATLCLFLRWYVRIWLDRKVRIEDALTICAYVCYPFSSLYLCSLKLTAPQGAYCGTAYAAYGMISTPGYYVHTWDLRNKDLIRPLYGDLGILSSEQMLLASGRDALFSQCAAHTANFAKSTDQMYFIGPLLFWACAEMTCGFFIFSVPCLSKLAMESGLRRRLSSVLDLSDKSVSVPSDQGSKPQGGSHPRLKPWSISDTTYSKIEEGNIIPLTNVSWPQGNLCESHSNDGNNTMQVIRTMDVSSADPNSSFQLKDHRIPWVS
ncbi:hypothetical protein ETB97_012205 [Aspergillus alliaceus]|uniref:Uncharacterized protein n=1 Tax=Petromyces alliaceus TaxID=209559 RepID=A0A8H6A3H8_PETAA|nr:hypothetical protein ETB97_012205 [Aspergillus burnettii]